MARLMCITLILFGWAALNTCAAAEKSEGLVAVVVNEAGSPVEGATCTIARTRHLRENMWYREMRTGVPWSVETDANGQVVIPMREADTVYDLQFDHWAYAPSFLYDVSPDVGDLRVVLTIGQLLMGRVERLVGGRKEPVRYATVVLRLPTEDFWYQRRALTDMDGTYSFQVNPPPDDMKWQVEFAGEVVQVTVTKGAPVMGIDFEIQVMARLRPYVAPVFDFTVTDIDGNDLWLGNFQGKVALIVNVASKCGFTPQYEGLQKLYAKYKNSGFVILGFPSNDFGRQEPGSNEQIKAFCTTTYGVQFPMFAKMAVKGENKHPLYKYLTDKNSNPKYGGEITWNFHKFLIGRDGSIIGRYDSKVEPDDPALMAAIEKALAE